MSGYLEHILLKVASLSEVAEETVNRLADRPNILTDEVTLLRQELEELNNHLALLTIQLEEEPDIHLSDEDKHQFMESFMVVNQELKIAQLYQFFGQDYLAPLKPTIRRIVATCLYNICRKKNYRPLDIWVNLAQS